MLLRGDNLGGKGGPVQHCPERECTN